MSNVIIGVEQLHKAKARAYMRTKADGTSSVIAEVLYRGRLFRSEVPILPGEGNIPAIHLALEEVRKQAKASQLTDLYTMERIA